MTIGLNGDSNVLQNRLLIVDDDEATCETLSDIFEEKGYTVATANTGNAAIHKAEGGVFNVTLIDIKLPDMDGVVLLREFKRLQPDMVCIVITGHASLDNAIKALEDGASGYFIKPFVVEEVIGRIEELIDKQRLQKELKESEERYRELVETSKDAIVSVNDRGIIVQWNEAASQIFGYKKEAAFGKPIDILFPQEYHKKMSGKFKGFLDLSDSKSRDRRMISLEGLNKNGNIVPVELSESVVKKGSSYTYTGIIRDITERKHAEEKIKRSYHTQNVISEALQISLAPIPFEEQLEKILDLILSIPWISLESKGCIYLANEDSQSLIMKAQRHLSGYLKKKCECIPFGRCLCGLAASTKETIFSNHIDARHETHYHDMLSHGHYCVPILSGDHVLGVINLYVKEGHQRDEREDEFLTAVANTLAGIIERNRSEKEKERLQVQLNQSERLSALGRITANVAHEIRNPLTSLGGFARRLFKKLPEGSNEKGYCEVIV
jgi:PAS domain S-box-containing protein